MRNARDLLKHELIGLEVEVTSSPDPGHIGLRGRVVDETRQTFLVSTKRGDKMLAKSNLVLNAFLGREAVSINGNDIMFRPEDRPKRIK
ncbi:MAG: ribonuclease P protein subunit [Candidatus Thermoplasmatota archaeon]|nr:ribonuclease P protein subunit [Candidatus Thermoplasmatota archaeon]